MSSAFVITTHHNGYLCVKECLVRVLHFAPESKVFLFVNEGEGHTLRLHEEFPSVDVTYVDRQDGGLTYTWNEGIRKCLLSGIETIVLLNDDALVNASISDLILAASNPTHLGIFGPGTSHQGTPFNPESWVYHITETPKETLSLRWLKQWHGLNGFCIAFHARMILSNMFDGLNFFDPSIPFGGNETEWGKRWYLKGGSCAVVYSCYVDHQKKRSWMEIPLERRKVNVHPPKGEIPKALIKDPPSYRVLVVSFVDAESEVDLYRRLPRVDRPRSYVALCSAPQDRIGAREVNGWRLIHSNVPKWNVRLRWKHMVGFLKNVVKKRTFEKVVICQGPAGICNDLSFFISSLGTPSLCTPSSKDCMYAGMDPTFPSLQARKASIEVTSDFLMKSFEMPIDSRPYFSEKLIVIDVAPKTLSFLQKVYEKGSLVDWNLDFCFNWVAWKEGVDLCPISERWMKKVPELSV